MSFLKRIGSLRKNSYSLSKRAELTSPYDNKSNIHCLVVLLDGTLLTCDIDVSSYCAAKLKYTLPLVLFCFLAHYLCLACPHVHIFLTASNSIFYFIEAKFRSSVARPCVLTSRPA